MLKIIIVCLFVGLIYANRDYPQFPSDIQRCHRGDNKCIQNALQYIMKTYPQGNPAINLPSIEPIHLDQFYIINEEKCSDFQINWKERNVDFIGFAAPNTKYTIDGFEKDIESSNVTIKIEIPRVIVDGDYELDLLYMKQRIYGNGHFTSDFRNIDFMINFTLTTFKKKKQEYLKIKTIKVDYTPRTVIISFDNLFDGNKCKSAKAHKLLNKYGTEFFNDLRSTIGPGWDTVFTEMIDSIFAKFPIDELFLPCKD